MASKIRYLAGWGDRPPLPFRSARVVRLAFPGVFDVQMTLAQMKERVDYVNSEGNYFEFVFSPVEEVR